VTLRWAIVVSFVLSLVVAYADHLRHPFGDISGGDKTDHLAHMHAARLFPRLGLRIYREPVHAMLAPLDDDAVARLPDGERRVIGSLRHVAYAVPGSRPAYVAWSSLPRPYPPGDMLAFAPVALLYETTAIPFALASLLLVVSCLAYAHVGLFVLWRSIHDEWRASPLVRWTACLVLAAPILYFALDGFYDVVLVAPIVLSARWLRDEKWSHAALAFAVAFFFHYRALFFVPYAVVAVAHAARSSRSREGPALLRLALAALLAGTALVTLLLVRRSLAAFPLTNPVNVASGHLLATAGYVALALLVVFAFSRMGSRLDAAVALSIFTILLSVRQVQVWHVIGALPWLATPTPATCRSPWPVRMLRAGAAAFVVLVLVS
jgi:hypothetical protein